MTAKIIYCDYAWLNSGITNIDHLTIGQSPTHIGLSINGVVGGADLMVVSDGVANTAFQITTDASLANAVNSHGTHRFNAGPNDRIGAIFRSNASGQTVNLTEWRDPVGGVAAYVSPSMVMVASGFSASGGQITSLGDGSGLAHAVNLDQLNVAISGVETQLVNYILLNPEDSDRNVIEPVASGAIPLTLQLPEFATAKLQSWKVFPGFEVGYVNSDGKLYASGLDALSNEVTDVGNGDSMTSATNVNQLNLAISGALPYWEHLFAVTVLGSSTALEPTQEGAVTSALEMSFARGAKLARVAVDSQHLHGSTPGDWIVTFHKNESATPFATFDYSYNAATLTDEVTVGAPTAFAGASLVMAAGDRYHIAVSGANIDNANAIRIVVGWEADGTI